MLNLDKELKALEGIGDILQSTITKTEKEISAINTDESKAVLSFIDELKDVMKTGKGVDELTDKLKNYENNKQ